MILEFEDYKIITDDMQFIVQKKKVVQASRFTKEENIGKESWVDMAYCATLDFALKTLGKQVVLDNDDLFTVMDKLNELEAKIEEFTSLLKLKKGAQ